MILTSRRQLLIGASLALLAPASRAAGLAQARLAALEASVGGRLGVAALDTGSDRRIDYRSSSLWPMCSTFKVLLAGAVLAKVDRGQEHLDRAIPVSAADLQDYAPIVKARLAQGSLPILELCAAAVSHSDNSAANLLLSTIGGPSGVTSFARSLGDHTTRLDRMEPALNQVAKGDPRDSTSPAAMLHDLGMLLLQDALSPSSRTLLSEWMVAATTGRDRLRAGLPGDWRVGDKTGTWNDGAVNDIAIAWPPGRRPLLITAFLTDSAAPLAARVAVLAEVGRVVAEDLVAGS